jgi:lauroyl/myristoyl acyltransferase
MRIAMATLTLPIERWLSRYLASEPGRKRAQRTKRTIYATLRRIAGDAMAQRLIVRWLKFLCGRAFAQRSIFPEATELLRQFATVFKLSTDDTREFLALSMMAREWREWRRIVELPHATLSRVTRVVGQQHLDACMRDGRGVILLLHHSQFSRLAIAYLREQGHDSVAVGMASQDLEQKGFQTEVERKFELGRQMHAAKHRLAKGGVVFNVPDAFQNLDSFRVVEFFGRERPIATGFAELALKSEARVMPVAYRLSPRGLFVLEYGAPFERPGPQTSHDERVGALVEQYAEFLRAEWRPYPWDIHWHHLHFFGELRPCSS